MAKLYTVEPYSTFSGIIVEDIISDNFPNKECIPLNTSEPFDVKRCIFLTKETASKIEMKRLGMIRHNMVFSGVILEKENSNFFLIRSPKNATGKIIYTSYLGFEVIKGSARYVIEPKPGDNHVLIFLESKTEIILYHPDVFSEKKISYNKLH